MATLFGEEERLAPLAPIGGGPTGNIGEGAGMGLGLAAPAAGPSLNLAPTGQQIAPRTQSDRDYIDSLPQLERFGLMLQSFKAGMEGRENPFDTLLKEKRAKEKATREDLTNTLGLIEQSLTISAQIPDGLQKEAFINQMSKELGPLAGLLGAASEQQKTDIKSAMAMVKNPAVREAMVSACTLAKDKKSCYAKFLNDDTKVKFIHSEYDSAEGPRLRAIVKEAGKTAKAQERELTVGLLSESGLLQPWEVESVRRRQTDYADLGDEIGLVADTTIKVRAEAAARIGERPITERTPGRQRIGDVEYQFDPDNAVKTGKRLTSDPRWVAMGPAGTAKTNELTQAQMARIRREKVAYDNAMTMIGKYGITEDGTSTIPKHREKLTRKTVIAGTNLPIDNAKFDAAFAGRVKAWLKATETGDPYEREGITTGERPETPAPAVKPAAAAPKTLPTIRTKAEFDALSVGTEFIDGRTGKRSKKAAR